MNPSAFGPVFVPAIALIGALIHIAVAKHRTRERILTIGLLWGLGVAVGLDSVVTAGSHYFAPAATAAEIGFPPGNPFQWEVATANLTFAVLGIACLWARSFWNATVVGFVVYYYGCAIGHVDQWLGHGNTAPYNSGPILPTEFIVPAILAALLIALRVTQTHGSDRGEHERVELSKV